VVVVVSVKEKSVLKRGKERVGSWQKENGSSFSLLLLISIPPTHVQFSSLEI
jgi:hypothetical protein